MFSLLTYKFGVNKNGFTKRGRPCAVYSMGDGSRHRSFSFAGRKKNKTKIFLIAVVGKFGLFSRSSDDFLTENLPTLYRNLQSFYNVGGKNIKKLECQLFFPVRNNFSSPEDPSPIEYSTHGRSVTCISVWQFRVPVMENFIPASMVWHAIRTIPNEDFIFYRIISDQQHGVRHNWEI